MLFNMVVLDKNECSCLYFISSPAYLGGSWPWPAYSKCNMGGLFFMLFRDGATLGRVMAMATVTEMGMERYFGLLFHQCLILKLFLLPGVRAS